MLKDRDRVLLELLSEHPGMSAGRLGVLLNERVGVRRGGRPDAAARNTLQALERRGWVRMRRDGITLRGYDRWDITDAGHYALEEG